MRLSNLISRLLSSLGIDQADRDLDEEIQHHIGLETERQIRDGHDLHTARRRALEKFGDPRRIAQATRDEREASWLGGTMEDVRWAMRILQRQAAFSGLALATLA